MFAQAVSNPWMDLFAIGVGGALGAVSRHAITRLMIHVTGGGHWGTLLANVAGCFVIGVLAGAVTAGWNLSDRSQLVWRTGFLGGLTTFSTFAIESVAFATDQRWGMATTYTIANLVLGLLAAWVGLMLGKSMVGG